VIATTILFLIKRIGMLAPETTEHESIIRRARPEESQQISDLALRSKAYWDYDAEFIEACRALLTITAEYIATNLVFVLEAQGQIVGFYSLEGKDDGVELENLFVEPSAIGRGYGKHLFQHAVETAKQLGFQHMLIESDPNAELFYQAMGALRIGERASPIRPDRQLPLMRLGLR
jgi:N-acetylglutamate synthase-like GNAT family acetyltransferase